MSSSKCYPKKAPKVDELLDTLSSSTKREVIHYFENVAPDDTASLKEVVSHIDDRVPTATPTELRTKLHHTDLQKLDSTGWVDYDGRTGTIRYYGNDDAERLLADVTRVFAE